MAAPSLPTVMLGSAHPPDWVSQLLKRAAALVRSLQLGVDFRKMLLISPPGIVFQSNPSTGVEIFCVKS
jgi:hypothetical protein